MRENSNINKALAYYIGYSTDDLIRYKASSGGIGTSIIKYLLSTSEYDTSMTFVYDKEKCGYIPKLIYDFRMYLFLFLSSHLPPYLFPVFIGKNPLLFSLCQVS